MRMLRALLVAGASVMFAHEALAAPPAASLPTPPASPAQPQGPQTLILRGLDKISGKPVTLVAPIGKAIHYATLTITASYCYSTPATETPETAAFVQIDDHRPDQPARRVFSGWMYASSPGLHGMEHPLYDVWVLNCKANAPDQAVAVGPLKPVKPVSPDAGDNEKPAELPDDAGQ